MPTEVFLPNLHALELKIQHEAHLWPFALWNLLMELLA